MEASPIKKVKKKKKGDGGDIKTKKKQKIVGGDVSKIFSDDTIKNALEGSKVGSENQEVIVKTIKEIYTIINKDIFNQNKNTIHDYLKKLYGDIDFIRWGDNNKETEELEKHFNEYKIQGSNFKYPEITYNQTDNTAIQGTDLVFDIDNSSSIKPYILKYLIIYYHPTIAEEIIKFIKSDERSGSDYIKQIQLNILNDTYINNIHQFANTFLYYNTIIENINRITFEQFIKLISGSRVDVNTDMSNILELITQSHTTDITELINFVKEHIFGKIPDAPSNLSTNEKILKKLLSFNIIYPNDKYIQPPTLTNTDIRTAKLADINNKVHLFLQNFESQYFPFNIKKQYNGVHIIIAYREVDCIKKYILSIIKTGTLPKLTELIRTQDVDKNSEKTHRKVIQDNYNNPPKIDESNFTDTIISVTNQLEGAFTGLQKLYRDLIMRNIDAHNELLDYFKENKSDSDRHLSALAHIFGITETTEKMVVDIKKPILTEEERKQFNNQISELKLKFYEYSNQLIHNKFTFSSLYNKNDLRQSIMLELTRPKENIIPGDAPVALMRHAIETDVASIFATIMKDKDIDAIFNKLQKILDSQEKELIDATKMAISIDNELHFVYVNFYNLRQFMECVFLYKGNIDIIFDKLSAALTALDLIIKSEVINKIKNFITLPQYNIITTKFEKDLKKLDEKLYNSIANKTALTLVNEYDDDKKELFAKYAQEHIGRIANKIVLPEKDPETNSYYNSKLKTISDNLGPSQEIKKIIESIKNSTSTLLQKNEFDEAAKILVHLREINIKYENASFIITEEKSGGGAPPTRRNPPPPPIKDIRDFIIKIDNLEKKIDEKIKIIKSTFLNIYNTRIITNKDKDKLTKKNLREILPLFEFPENYVPPVNDYIKMKDEILNSRTKSKEVSKELLQDIYEIDNVNIDKIIKITHKHQGKFNLSDLQHTRMHFVSGLIQSSVPVNNLPDILSIILKELFVDKTSIWKHLDYIRTSMENIGLFGYKKDTTDISRDIYEDTNAVKTAVKNIIVKILFVASFIKCKYIQYHNFIKGIQSSDILTREYRDKKAHGNLRHLVGRNIAKGTDTVVKGISNGVDVVSASVGNMKTLGKKPQLSALSKKEGGGEDQVAKKKGIMANIDSGIDYTIAKIKSGIEDPIRKFITTADNTLESAERYYAQDKENDEASYILFLTALGLDSINFGLDEFTIDNILDKDTLEIIGIKIIPNDVRNDVTIGSEKPADDSNSSTILQKLMEHLKQDYVFHKQKLRSESVPLLSKSKEGHRIVPKITEKEYILYPIHLKVLMDKYAEYDNPTTENKPTTDNTALYNHIRTTTTYPGYMLDDEIRDAEYSNPIIFEDTANEKKVYKDYYTINEKVKKAVEDTPGKLQNNTNYILKHIKHLNYVEENVDRLVTGILFDKRFNLIEKKSLIPLDYDKYDRKQIELKKNLPKELKMFDDINNYNDFDDKEALDIAAQTLLNWNLEEEKYMCKTFIDYKADKNLLIVWNRTPYQDTGKKALDKTIIYKALDETQKNKIPNLKDGKDKKALKTLLTGILNEMKPQKPYNFITQGGSGSGKTYTSNNLLEVLVDDDDTVKKIIAAKEILAYFTNAKTPNNVDSSRCLTRNYCIKGEIQFSIEGLESRRILAKYDNVMGNMVVSEEEENISNWQNCNEENLPFHAFTNEKKNDEYYKKYKNFKENFKLWGGESTDINAPYGDNNTFYTTILARVDKLEQISKAASIYNNICLAIYPTGIPPNPTKSADNEKDITSLNLKGLSYTRESSHDFFKKYIEIDKKGGIPINTFEHNNLKETTYLNGSSITKALTFRYFFIRNIELLDNNYDSTPTPTPTVSNTYIKYNIDKLTELFSTASYSFEWFILNKQFTNIKYAEITNYTYLTEKVGNITDASITSVVGEQPTTINILKTFINEKKAKTAILKKLKNVVKDQFVKYITENIQKLNKCINEFIFKNHGIGNNNSYDTDYNAFKDILEGLGINNYKLFVESIIKFFAKKLINIYRQVTREVTYNVGFKLNELITKYYNTYYKNITTNNYKNINVVVNYEADIEKLRSYSETSGLIVNKIVSMLDLYNHNVAELCKELKIETGKSHLNFSIIDIYGFEEKMAKTDTTYVMDTTSFVINHINDRVMKVFLESLKVGLDKNLKVVKDKKNQRELDTYNNYIKDHGREINFVDKLIKVGARYPHTHFDPKQYDCIVKEFPMAYKGYDKTDDKTSGNHDQYRSLYDTLNAQYSVCQNNTDKSLLHVLHSIKKYITYKNDLYTREGMKGLSRELIDLCNDSTNITFDNINKEILKDSTNEPVGKPLNTDTSCGPNNNTTTNILLKTITNIVSMLTTEGCLTKYTFVKCIKAMTLVGQGRPYTGSLQYKVRSLDPNDNTFVPRLSSPATYNDDAIINQLHGPIIRSIISIAPINTYTLFKHVSVSVNNTLIPVTNANIKELLTYIRANFNPGPDLFAESVFDKKEYKGRVNKYNNIIFPPPNAEIPDNQTEIVKIDGVEYNSMRVYKQSAGNDLTLKQFLENIFRLYDIIPKR